jgi:hypothetical protein
MIQRGALAAIAAEVKAIPLHTNQPRVTKGGFNGEEVVRNALGSGCSLVWAFGVLSALLIIFW